MVTMKASQLPLPRLAQGKVRDIYAVEADRLLLVATDRVSAFDVVMNEAVPLKGQVLTQMSAWWFGQLDGIVDHHMITADTEEIIRAVPALDRHREDIAGRAMLCRRTTVFPVECVVRGYLSGSAWKEYKELGTLAGERLPEGLLESQMLTPSLFSPATKAETGHDENISVSRLRALVGKAAAAELDRMSRAGDERGGGLALGRGLSMAATQFEFGRDAAGRILLIDEVLTPDSSRFWSADEYAPGRPQASFDKQPLRDFLDAERRAGRWNGEAPAPRLPADLVEATSRRYQDAFRRLTGLHLPGTAGH
ncbi:MAG: phosphoribosylaminoimidazolesuccinocarboxamide synthase [Hyphomicrobiaceae bacterium]